MADTIKDYLVGFGFDVDDSGASQIESMLKSLDTIVRNLGTVLTQATEKVQGFMTDLQQQSETANKSAEGVEQLAQNTQHFSNEADAGSHSASFFGGMLLALSNSANRADSSLDKASEKIKETGDSAKKATPQVQGMTNAVFGLMKVIKLIAGAAVVKKFLSVAKSLYEYDQKLEQTAKSLHMTTEEARAHTKALEAMGRTYEEVKKDKNLKATYDEFVALGKSMALPEASDGVDHIHDMITSFEKLKMVGSYAMQWLYHAVQEVAAGPLTRFKDTIDDITKNLKLNMPRLSVAGARIIDGILRIVSAFAKGAAAILKFLDKIPGPIKVIIGLITAAALAIKHGPFGWMVIILTAIGALLDDFFTYMEGGEALLGPFWDQCIDVYNKIKTSINDAIEALQGFWAEATSKEGKTDFITFGSKVAGWIINGIRSGLKNLGTQIKTWITGNENASWSEVGTAIVEKIKSAILAAQDVGKQIIEAVFQLIGEQNITEDIIALLTNAGDFASGILTAIINAIPDLAEGATENITAIIEGIAGLINGKFLTEDIPSLITNASEWAKGILNAIIDAIPLLAQSGSDLLSSLVTAICGLIDGITSDQFIGSLTTFAMTLVTGIATALGTAVENVGQLSEQFVEPVGQIANNIMNALSTVFSEDNLGTVGKSIEGFVSSLFKAIGDVIGNALDSVGNLNGFSLGSSAGEIAENILKAIFTTVGDLADNPNVTGFVEKIGNALSDALGTIGSFVGTAAGKIVGYIFSAEGLTQIYNVAKSVGKLIIQGIAEGIKGFGNFVLNTIEGVLVGLGIIDQEQIEAMRNSGEQLGKTTAMAYEQGLDESDSPAVMLANWALKGVGKNNAALDPVKQNMVDMFGGMIGAAADEVTKNGGTAEQFRNKLLEKMLSSDSDFEEKLILDPSSVVEFASGDLDYISTMKNFGMKPEDFLPNFDDLDFWGAMMTAVQSGDSSQVADLVNSMLTDKIDFGEAEQEIKDQAGEAISNAIDEVNDIIGDSADDVNMDDLFSEVDTEAPRQAVEEMATTLTDGKGDVEVAAAEVSDAAVQKFLLTMSNENGASIAQSFLDGMTDKLGTLVDFVDELINKIIEKFMSIGSKGASSFFRVASAARSALNGLPKYVEGIVEKVNKALANIKSPKITVPTVGGSTPHSSEGRRVDHEMVTRVGEGGKREYIIPVTKPNRGIPLLKQAAADLGLTVESYANATRLLGGSPDRNVTPAAAAAVSSSSVVNHYNTIDAHAEISVSGNDPRSTANNVNKSHEQVILRNVKPLLG